MNAGLFNDVQCVHALKYMIVALFTSDIQSFADEIKDNCDDIQINRRHVLYKNLSNAL